MNVTPDVQELETYWHTETQEGSFPTFLRLEGTEVNLTQTIMNAEKWTASIIYRAWSNVTKGSCNEIMVLPNGAVKVNATGTNTGKLEFHDRNQSYQ